MSISSGLAASRPAPTGSGNLYLRTDLPALYWDSTVSSKWEQYASERLPEPPAVGSYTTAGNIGLTQFADAIRVLATSNAASNGACALVASGALGSAAAWTVTLVASYAASFYVASPEIGVCVTNGTTVGTSTGTTLLMYTSITATNGLNGFEVDLFTVGGARSSTPYSQASVNEFLFGTGRLHLRLLADGTNMHCQGSSDGFNWIDIYTSATPSGMTNYGFFIGLVAPSGSAYGQGVVYSNQLGTPTQYSVTGVTNGSPGSLTIGAHTIVPGDLVSVHGVGGSTGVNSGTGGGSLAGGAIVSAVTGTTITLAGTTFAGAYTSGGTVTLLSR